VKAVILSAGYGSRLKAPIPKSLVRFSSGKCLLDYQLAALTKFVLVQDIFIIVGFKKELIMEAAPACTFLYNDRFDRTNTAKSLALALERLDDDILWINGDVYAEPNSLERIAKAPGNAILVERSRVSDEEVCFTMDAKGNIARLAKNVSMAEGEALGINKVRRTDVKALTKLLGEVSDKDYFERGIELGIERGLFSFSPVDAQGQFVKEMDFQADLDAIEIYLNKQKN
jgi:L-glutamine-phosphate cytidylyltransferase